VGIVVGTSVPLTGEINAKLRRKRIANII